VTLREFFETFASVWNQVNEIIPLSLAICVAVAISTALLMLDLIMRRMAVSLLEQWDFRKSKDEEETPKRKFVNGILMREGDWINEALMEPEDGDIVYYEFEDEEERIEHR
jgi:hypothetical protein